MKLPRSAKNRIKFIVFKEKTVYNTASAIITEEIKMKKIIALILVSAFMFALAACGETKVDTDVKGEGVMTYAEYDAAALEAEVVIETYVQAKQSWWDNKATVYTQDKDGAYFLYNMACTEEQYAKLVPGQKIKVTGHKAEWSGEVEIIDATFELEEGNYIAEAVDVTALLGTDDLVKKQNQYVSFKGLTVVARTDDAGNEYAFQYSYDGSGSKESNSDLYFDVTDGKLTYTFTVESYLCDSTTAVYAAVENLKVGDIIDMTGFLYWYNGVNPHITEVKVVG